MDIVDREEPDLEWKLQQPTIWSTLTCGVRIQDLQAEYYDEVAELIRTQLIPRETMCKALNMAHTDPVSCNELVQEAIYCMRDGFSVVGLVDEEENSDESRMKTGSADRERTESYNASYNENKRVVFGNSEEEEEEIGVRIKTRVVAAMIGRVVQQGEGMETLSRFKIYKGEAYKKYADLNNHMMRTADLYTAFDTRSYYRIYHVVVHDDYKNRGIALFMGKLAIRRLTALFNQSICVKLCPDRPTQHLMRRLGFTDYLRLGYEEWIEKGNQVFFNTGVGNYSLVLMLYKVPEGEILDVNKPLEEGEEVIEHGPPTTFPGRSRTGQPSVGNRGHLIKPAPPVVTGRLADYRYLFEKGFNPVPRKSE